MLHDMPDENNTALAKRKAIQAVMQDKSLNGVERNKKMQDIMAGRVELPKVEPRAGGTKKDPSLKVAAANLHKKMSAVRSASSEVRASRATTPESSDSNSDSSDSGSSYEEDSNLGSSVENTDPTDKAESPAAVGAGGADKMLTDMPDEDETALAKRRAIKKIMQDRSLGGSERMKMMQDVMAGRVELPKVEPRVEPVKESRSPPPPPKRSKSPPPSKRPKSPQPTLKAQSTAARKSRDQRVLKKKDSNDSNREKSAKSAEIEPGSKSVGASKGKLQSFPSGRAKPEVKATAKGTTTTKNKNAANSMRLLPIDVGGILQTRNAMSREWKERMTAIHPRSHDDPLDVLLAHRYRLSLRTPPQQSYFRVVAVVFFSRIGMNGVRSNERYHVVGTNDEPHAIGGSICAERAALMQLRFVPDLEAITKVVIVTDDADAISPGMLCREFMASHNRIPWNVPIVLGRSVCRRCGFTVSGNVCSDSNGCFDEAANKTLKEASGDLFATCAKDDTSNMEYPPPHDFVGTITKLEDLFPYPSLYTRLSAKEALRFGESHMERSSIISSSRKSKSKEANYRSQFADGNRQNNNPNGKSYREENFDLTMLTDIMEGDEEGTGGEKSLDSSFASNNESFTNSSTTVGRRNISPSRTTRKHSMTKSLKTTIDLMRQMREEPARHELDISGLTGLSDLPATLEHLTARTLRISSRLKPSQRREKLMRFATEVTALESHMKHAHPLRYGAAVLFSDNTVAIASQKVALEYGCTLDAVGQLASIIDRKGIQIEEDGPSCRPVLLVQCDQFGIAHAPFAPGRAYLTERGYGDCKVLVHQKRQGKKANEAKDPPQAAHGGTHEEGSHGNSNVDLRLLEVEASDLAPAPPDMFGGFMTKNHSQASDGLQIQF